MILRPVFPRAFTRHLYLVIVTWSGAALLFALHRPLLASLTALLGLAVTVSVALLVAGSRVLLTSEGAFVRVGFLQYFTPWGHIRGFELDNPQKPFTLYMVAWHPSSSAYRRFEVLPLGGPAATCMLALLQESAAPHLHRTASDRPA